MTQATPVIGANKSGLQYRTEDNDGKKALLNHHKGPAAPSYAEAGMIWLDDTATPWALKIYDGADWIRLGDVNATANTFNPYVGTSSSRLLSDAADTGAANAYALAPVPAITAYATGQIVTLKPANANTGASTLAVSGLAAKNIKLLDGTNPVSGALATTGVYQLVYDGTNFVLLNGSVSTIGNTTTITVKDANFTIQDDGDTTKQVQFQASGITTATTRTVTVPDKNGTMAMLSDVGADPFTASTSLGASDDWNTLTTAGIYKTSGTTYSNGPLFVSDTTGLLRIDAGSSLSTRIQEWTETASGDVWKRSYDGTNWTMWRPFSPPSTLSNYIQKFTDFPSLDADVSTSATGTGAAVALSSADNYRGIITITLGTSATNSAQLYLNETNWKQDGTAKFSRMETVVAIPTLSTSAQRFSTMIGWGQNRARTDVNALCFSCIDNENGGNWIFVSDVAGTETVTNTSVAPVAGVYTRFSLERNAANTQVRGYIDGVLVATHTTNIPAVSLDLTPYVLAAKSVGTTSRTVNVDSLYHQVQR